MQIAPDTWVWQVYPRGAPQDEGTEQLVQRLRGDVLLDETGLEVVVGGWTAGGIDFSAYIGDRLPYLIGTVLLLSFILLMAVFRSILVPLKAVIMNLLSSVRPMASSSPCSSGGGDWACSAWTGPGRSSRGRR